MNTTPSIQSHTQSYVFTYSLWKRLVGLFFRMIVVGIGEIRTIIPRVRGRHDSRLGFIVGIRIVVIIVIIIPFVRKGLLELQEIVVHGD